jgi:alanyl-tRNA synthetase
MGQAYPELEKQKTIIESVILSEEQSFLTTLAKGIKILETAVEKQGNKKVFDGTLAFELYDTYGFPLDLTELILREKGMQVDVDSFNKAMAEQKNRSRKDAEVATDDWTILNENTDVDFQGYDALSCESNLVRYRKTNVKGKDLFHLVFDKTPFYGEGGGQAGDAGYIEISGKKIHIFDTQKEHGLIIHYTKELPADLTKPMLLQVNDSKRLSTTIHHSAAHLVHYALREVLGKHVEQKGSSVNEKGLRFDFSHFQKMTAEEIEKTEALVNQIIRANYSLEEKREATRDEATEMGALALFGEKYGDKVRVVKFGDSVELCGGTHAKATGDLGLFKITTETSIAAGIRRVEAVVGLEAEKYINSKMELLSRIEEELKSTGDVLKQVESLIAENQKQKKKIEQFQKVATAVLKEELKNSAEKIGEINFIAKKVDVDNADIIKDIAFQLKNEIEDLVLVAGANLGGKANLTIMISENLTKKFDLHAGNMVRALAKNIQGGGGGQAFFASAGGKNPEGITNAIEEAKQRLKDAQN